MSNKTPTADEETVSPDDLGESQATTPNVIGEHSFLFTQQVFEIAQSLGRTMERLESQGEQIQRIDTTIQTLDEKVDGIARDFGIIKKIWWLGLIVLGFCLKVGYDTFIKPVIG